LQFFEMLAIAVALAMDAFAVSIAVGVSLGSVSFRQTFRLAWHFGLFQALMPIIGWSAGTTVRSLIEIYDHWLAFGLLALIGLKMIWEAFNNDSFEAVTLVMFSIATSIDALAVGFSISLIKMSIWAPILIIGTVAGIFTVIGLQFGKKLGSIPRLSYYAEIAGGTVLLVLGFKVLHEHGALQFLL